FSSRRRHTRSKRDWSSDVCSSDLPGINEKEYAKLEIPLPNLNEQRKIASILSTWDKAIELKEKLIEQKKEQKKGLMQKLLTGEEIGRESCRERVWRWMVDENCREI